MVGLIGTEPWRETVKLTRCAMPGWRNGRRVGLKNLYLRVCGFDSHPGHHHNAHSFAFTFTFTYTHPRSRMRVRALTPTYTNTAHACTYIHVRVYMCLFAFTLTCAHSHSSAPKMFHVKHLFASLLPNSATVLLFCSVVFHVKHFHANLCGLNELAQPRATSYGFKRVCLGACDLVRTRDAFPN